MADPGAPSGARTDRYGGVARFFHWSIAGLIALQYLLAKLGEHAGDEGERLRQLALLANHKSVGMTVLALAIARVGWRLVKTPPELPLAMPTWQRVASFCSHWSLYALIFALPVTGWLMSSAAAYSVSWFSLFTWPDLVEPSTALRDAMKVAHDVLGKLLFVVVIVHILAALKHHFLDRDDVLRRMSSVMSIALFAVVFAGGALALARAGSGARPAHVARDTAAPAAVAEEEKEKAAARPKADADAEPTEAEAAEDKSDEGATLQPAEAEATTDPVTAPERVVAGTPVPDPASVAAPDPKPEPEPAPEPATWRIDYDTSYIEFTAEQAGAPFTGRWTDWSADMRFDAAALDASRFDVRIRVAGVDTNDADRDSTLQDAEFFDAASHPVVRFQTGPITADGDAFKSESTLEIKGTSHPVTFRFEVVADGASRVLTGTARLDRLALNVGTGEWTDTEWVGQYVDVSVRVAAEVATD